MNIRQLVPTNAEQFRKVRIMATQQEPVAFGPSAEEEAALPTEAFRQRLQSSSLGSVFGAFVGDQLIGIVTIRGEADAKRGHIGQIFGLYVVPERRNCGVGGNLLMAATDAAANNSALKRLRAFVNSGNGAYKLFLAAGFKEFGLEPEALEHNGRYYDAHHLSLQLGSSR